MCVSPLDGGEYGCVLQSLSTILQSYILYISFPGCAGNTFNPNMLHNPHISKWQLVGKNPCMGCWKIRTYVMLLQIPSRSTCFFTPSECWISLERATLHSIYSLLHKLKISFIKKLLPPPNTKHYVIAIYLTHMPWIFFSIKHGKVAAAILLKYDCYISSIKCKYLYLHSTWKWRQSMVASLRIQALVT